MKNKTLLHVLFATLAGSLLTVMPARAALTDGLIGYWALNEGRGHSTAADASFSGNNGALLSFTNTDFTTMWTAASKFDNAILFNQVNETSNCVSVPHAASFDTIPNNKKFTLAAWVNLSVEATNQSNGSIITKGVDGTDAYILFIWQGKFRIRERIGDGSVTVAVSSTTTPATGTWYHVVATWNNQASQRMHIYVNGVEEGNSGGNTRTTVYANTHPVTIGNWESSATSGYNRPFKGTIDDVRIYNRALTADEVTQLYNGSPAAPSITAQPRSVNCYSNDTAVFQTGLDLGITPASFQWRFNGADVPGATTTSLALTNVTIANAGTYTFVATNFMGSVTSSPATLTVQTLPAPDTASGLVGWWKFNDGSGSSTAADSSVSANAGALTGFSDAGFASMWGNGIINGALFFNGDNTGLNLVALPSVGTPAPPALDFSGSPVFTLSAWVNASLIQGSQAGIIAKGTGAGGEQYCLDINGTYYRFFVRDASGTTFAVPSTVAINGFWQHVVAVVNATNGLLNLYVNGVLAGSGVAPASLLANSHEVSLGNRQSGSAGYDYPFTGALDDVRIYSRDLTAADVYALYTQAAFPLITGQSPIPYTNLFTLYQGASPTLRVSAVSGATPFSYQWYTNGVAASGATNASYSLTNLPLGGFTNYYCIVTNPIGSATSIVWSAVVVAPPTTPYARSVLDLGPIAYWRLDEPDGQKGDGNPGVPAHDYRGGDNGYYTNVVLGQPGYGQGLAWQFAYNPPADPETSPAMPYGALTDGGAFGIGGIDFSSPTNTSRAFTVAAWVSGSPSQFNGAGLVTKGYGGKEQFNLDVSGSGSTRGFRFLVRDAATGATHGYTSTVNLDGYWHHVVGVCDQPNGTVYLYIDGVLAGQASITTGSGIFASTHVTSIGARRQDSTTSYNWAFSGNINDVAIYGYALSAGQVLSNYLAAGIGPRITQQPQTSATVTEPGTLTLSAAAWGTPPLTYQWVDSYATPSLADQTNATLVLSNVTASLNGDIIWLRVSSAYGTVNSGNAQLNVIWGPPQIVAVYLPQKVEVPLGKTYTYAVSATGTIPFSYQWYDGGSPVANQTNATYTAAATALGSRTNSVVVTNARGSATASSTMMVVPMPTDSYAAAILGMHPAGYWPLQETSAPAPVSVETNYGTLGAIGTAYYPVTNGTVIALGQGGALTASGDNDSSVTFNGGASSYAFVPRINNNLTLQPPITLECWMNPTTTAGTQDAICQGGSGLNSIAGNGNYGGFRMSFGSGTGDGDALQFFAYTGSGGIYNVGNTNIETPPGAILRNQWNHCVVTYDGTTVLEYVNGQLLASGTTTWAPDTWTPLTIGAGRWQGQAGTRNFRGGLDEVAIYTNILTGDEITNHYQAGITASSDYKGMVLGQHPLLYYRMDAPALITPNPGTCPSAVNYGSALANGAYQAGVLPGSAAGPTFMGVGTLLAAPINGIFSCVDAGNDPDFNRTTGQPFTAMAWFKGNPSDGRLQTLMGHGTNWALNLDGTSGKVTFTPNNTTTLTASNIVNDANWHMAVGVYDGTTANLYLDGAVMVTQTATGSVVGDPTAYLFLGGDSDFITVGNNQRFFAGALAQAAYFTNALTGTQIQDLYTAVVPNPTISIGWVGNNVVINYNYTLVSSTNAAGPFEPVVGAQSPYTVPLMDAQRFYRTRNP